MTPASGPPFSAVVFAITLCLAPAHAVAQSNEPTHNAAAEKRTTPTFGIEVGRYTEELRLDLANGTSSSDTRPQWNTRFSLGLSHRFAPPFLRTGSFRSQSEGGFGVLYAAGDWTMHLRQLFTWNIEVAQHFALSIGPGTDFQVNVVEPAFSYWALGTALGLSWGPAELVWYPRLTVPLGQETREVYQGTLKHGVRTGVVPLHLVLRFHLRKIAF